MVYVKLYPKFKTNYEGSIATHVLRNNYTICSSPLCRYLNFIKVSEKCSKALILVGFVNVAQK